MNLFKAHFDGITVRFSIKHSQMCFFDDAEITALAQYELEQEGVFPEIHEVHWEEL